MKFAAIIAVMTAVLVLTLAGTANSATNVKLPKQCMVTGKVLCISKADRKLRFVQNGRVRLVLDARFGDTRGSGFRTREGSFTIFRKVRHDVSVQYNNAPMPFSMYFSGGQAVHYSYSFAREGYAGSSHGCVNIRDMNKLGWLYDQVPVGTSVFIS